MVPIKVDIEAESPAIRNEFFVDSISELLEYKFFIPIQSYSLPTCSIF